MSLRIKDIYETFNDFKTIFLVEKRSLLSVIPLDIKQELIKS